MLGNSSSLFRTQLNAIKSCSLPFHLLERQSLQLLRHWQVDGSGWEKFSFKICSKYSRHFSDTQRIILIINIKEVLDILCEPILGLLKYIPEALCFMIHILINVPIGQRFFEKQLMIETFLLTVRHSFAYFGWWIACWTWWPRKLRRAALLIVFKNYIILFLSSVNQNHLIRDRSVHYWSCFECGLICSDRR